MAKQATQQDLDLDSLLSMDGGHARGRNSGGLLQLMQAKQGSPSRVRFFEGEGSGFEQLLINQHYHWLIQNFIDEGWKVLKVYYIVSLGCDYLTILYESSEGLL